MSLVTAIQDREIVPLLADKPLVVIYFPFYRSDPRHQLDPILVTISGNHKSYAKIVNIDTDKNKVISQNCKVYIITAIFISKIEKLMDKLLGITPCDRLITVL